MSQEVMTVDELAEYLDLSPSTIYQKVHEKSIPYTKMRNLLRFPKDIIDAWLAQNTVHPEPDERQLKVPQKRQLEVPV